MDGRIATATGTATGDRGSIAAWPSFGFVLLVLGRGRGQTPDSIERGCLSLLRISGKCASSLEVLDDSCSGWGKRGGGTKAKEHTCAISRGSRAEGPGVVSAPAAVPLFFISSSSSSLFFR